MLNPVVKKFFDFAPTPQLDNLNLRVDVGIVKPEKNFTIISRGIWFVEWANANILNSQFGGDTALTIGIQIVYNNKPLLPVTIKHNHDFSRYAYDTRVDSDDTAPQINSLVSRFSFFKFVKGGLKMGGKNNFEVLVQDDLSSSDNSEICLMLEGEQ